ncbi:ankyrin repeat domain-containing protein, partial [bacterium]|nr:ankyrin repeat domain-containing protein [bacterium]
NYLMFMEVIMKTLKTILVSFLTIFSLFSLNASQVPALIQAITDTDINAVNKILSQEIDFPNYLSPLHFALKVTDKLASNKALSEQRKKSLEVIKLLIDSGAQENTLNRHGQTPLDVVIKDCKHYGNHLAFMLLDSYKREGESALHKIVSVANNYFALKNLESVHFLAMLTRKMLDEKAREMLRRNTRTKETPDDLACAAKNKIFIAIFEEYLPKAQHELGITPKVTVPPLLKRNTINGQMEPTAPLYDTLAPEYDTLASLRKSLEEQKQRARAQSIYGTLEDLQINPASSSATHWPAGYETSSDPSLYDTLEKIPFNDSGCLITEDPYLMPGKKVDTLKEKERRETLQRGTTIPANFHPYNKPN